MNESRGITQPGRSRVIGQCDALAIVHWFDFICPFCYITQDWDALIFARGIDVVSLALRAHPEIPPARVHVGPRHGPTYRNIEARARAADLALNWPSRLPSSGSALDAAEWVRRNRPTISRDFNTALFEAHFVLNEDVGDKATILRKAKQLGLDTAALDACLEDGSAAGWLRESEAMAYEYGVRLHGSIAAGFWRALSPSMSFRASCRPSRRSNPMRSRLQP
ncbi:DsbA family oxidoreductase [Bradyrhizobium sp. AZCC 2230]|uniref:DsbA family oxidoreductase n=1 Tax=Bradyrhizobium sp. AZCC 2230 TaxID=3117021 RepID=UPI002FF2B612